MSAHTPGPWAIALRKDYPEFADVLRVEYEPKQYSHAHWAGYIGSVAQGFAEHEDSCWAWLERNAYFVARNLHDCRAALAKVQP